MYHGEQIKREVNTPFGKNTKYYRWCIEHGEIPAIEFMEKNHALCIQRPKNGAGVDKLSSPKAITKAVGK